jgi:hypothetical protein
VLDEHRRKGIGEFQVVHHMMIHSSLLALVFEARVPELPTSEAAQ